MAVLFCDTNCELWFDKAEELGLNVIRMPYTFDGEEYYYDLGERTDFKDFYDKIRAGSKSITSALNAHDYKEYFEKYFSAGEDILYISFSDKLSATFASMDEAVKELRGRYPKTRFIRFDTRNISMGAGIQVYLAAKYFNSGKTIDETVEYLKEINSRIGVLFAVDDLKYLKRGGRISALQAAIGTILNIKPVITVSSEGKLEPMTKVNGAKLLSFMAEQVATKGKELDKYPIVIMHADEEKKADDLITKIKAVAGDVDIWKQPVGPTVGTHCGPGTLGVIYFA